MQSKAGSDLSIGDKIVYVTTSGHQPIMRFGTITNITESRLEDRYKYQFFIPGKLQILTTEGKVKYTRGYLVYKLEEIDNIFKEVK